MHAWYTSASPLENRAELLFCSPFEATGAPKLVSSKHVDNTQLTIVNQSEFNTMAGSWLLLMMNATQCFGVALSLRSRGNDIGRRGGQTLRRRKDMRVLLVCNSSISKKSIVSSTTSQHTKHRLKAPLAFVTSCKCPIKQLSSF